MSIAEPQTDPAAPSATSKRHLRFLIRCTCLIAAVLCLLPLLPDTSLARYVPAASALVATASLLATRTLRPIMVLGLIAALFALFRHRWFCRWACPVGLCMDGASCLGRRLKRKPSLGIQFGYWLAAMTLGGAILGYPLFLYLDPLALFSGIFLTARYSTVPLSWISALLFAVLLIACAFKPNFWCARACPLGAFQDLLAILSRYIRSLFAPKTRTPAETNAGYRIARRTALGMVVGAGCAAAVRRIGPERAPSLRPPGALDEATFVGLCTRCGNCIRACPHGIIERNLGEKGWAGILTPVLSFENDYCREDCTRCTEICPAGAIIRIPPDEKSNVRIGLPRVDMDICLLSEDKECSACMRWCPYEAISYIFSKESYSLIPVIDPKKCNGCGACQTACPTRPTKAIRVVASVLS
ncbi:MAG: 4Fe-4S binding protein [Sedimentisphaerales bacterium]|nr:4Fe-4S binding protein [Sedimentisphaerales bacterium]